MPCDQILVISSSWRASTFSSLLIGICLVTSYDLARDRLKVAFQFPSHRDMPCDLSSSSVVSLERIAFSSLLIGICLVTSAASEVEISPVVAFSSLLIGICLVTQTKAKSFAAIAMELSVPFSSGYAL